MASRDNDQRYGIGECGKPVSLGKGYDPSCMGGSIPNDMRQAQAEGSKEVNVVDPTTGGAKGAKLQRFSLIPRDFLWDLAMHYGRGAKKYDDRNWERGYRWSLTVDALERHYAAWMLGEDNDSETGSSHLIAVAWHVIALWWFHKHSKGTDDVRVGDAVREAEAAHRSHVAQQKMVAPEEGYWDKPGTLRESIGYDHGRPTAESYLDKPMSVQTKIDAAQGAVQAGFACHGVEPHTHWVCSGVCRPNGSCINRPHPR